MNLVVVDKTSDERRPVSICYSTGKDEMNLLEYSFSSASNRASRSIDELLFEHQARDPETGQSVVRRVSMSFSSKYGRPTIEDDQVYVGFQALTYLTTFDLDEYRAVRGGIAKKLFRYANKRLWKRHRFVIGLRPLAEEKLGFKPGQFESELTRSLAGPFTELKRFGIVCTIKQQGRSKQVQITKKELRKRGQKKPSSPVPGLAKQLLARGVELVQRFDAEKIRDQIENFDDRRRHGNSVGPGWLRCAIEKDYGFRKGFKPSRLAAEEKKARAKKRVQALAAKDREEAELQAQQAADKEAFSMFLKFRDSLSDQRCRDLEGEALSKCSGFVRSFVLKARRNNEVGMFHQLLWEQHIIPTVAKK